MMKINKIENTLGRISEAMSSIQVLNISSRILGGVTKSLFLYSKHFNFEQGEKITVVQQPAVQQP